MPRIEGRYVDLCRIASRRVSVPIARLEEYLTVASQPAGAAGTEKPPANR